MGMSIKLRFEKGSLATQVVLKDAALGPLLALVAEHQADEPAAPLGAPPPAASVVIQATETSAGVREWLLKHTPSEVLNRFHWDTNPDKILLLGAYHEANSKTEVWRSSDIGQVFRDAKEGFPTNFPRDIKTAIKSGFIASVTDRRYRVSRTGWNRISEQIQKIEEPAPIPLVL